MNDWFPWKAVGQVLSMLKGILQSRPVDLQPHPHEYVIEEGPMQADVKEDVDLLGAILNVIEGPELSE